ncbi:helix-turn-helix domain-containing protein [Paenibacillus daejeonensis]|uniref:helix-turn-helix domain-containing protein n=1 Tax=Paenibacillus daejeonensis TaxID=135193 RepID=UPI00036FCF44|nr:helix-turn-helix transcriptional regulator [Paenibacillus daejeonensis]
MEKLHGMGKKIAQLRQSHGMTQEALGKRLSVSAQAVSKWENGDSLPDLSLVAELSVVFHCTTDYLLGRESGLEALLPQIRESFGSLSTEQKVSFLGQIITLAEAPLSTPSTEPMSHPSLVQSYLGPTGIGLWAQDRMVCIATTTFLNEAVEALGKEVQFPLHFVPDEIRHVLLALLRSMEDLKPDYAMDEKTLQSIVPSTVDCQHVLQECIELGFVDRVRGGYRLNFKGDLAVRLLALLHQTISKPGMMNVTVGNS